MNDRMHVSDSMSPVFTLGELAQRFALELSAGSDPSLRISGVHTLAQATAGQLSFFANSRYRAELKQTGAAAVLIAAKDQSDCTVPALIARDPYQAFAAIAALFERRERMVAGVHPSAVVEAGALIDPSAAIGPLSCIAGSARIAAGVQIGAHCVIGPDCEVGPDTVLHPRVTLVKRVRLGARVILHSGAVLGADGFGLARTREGWTKVPQMGGVVLGDDCEVGANSTIDCGALGDTVLAADVRIDNQVQIGHNVQIGAHTAIAGCTGIAGSAQIGANCLIAGACGIGGHISIPDGTTILGMTMVTHEIHQAGVYAGGPPVMDNASWRRNMARLRRLDELARQVQQLTRQSKQSEQGSHSHD
jgi:UDP-3-O-[3-hydroxymyristoyl] glucosamine N-acyltransferase